MPLRVAVVARSVYPLHRFGGLERHVYDLVRYLLARDVSVTLIAPLARRSGLLTPTPTRCSVIRSSRMRPVPYMTFPFANRRGTTILDRSTAYPLFGLRAGRLAARLVDRGRDRRRSRPRRQRARLRVGRPRCRARARSCSIRRGSRNSARPIRRAHR